MRGKPAQIGRGVIRDGEGEKARRYYVAAGRFIVHKSFCGRGWSVTLPSGAALGVSYWTKDAARDAADVMAPMVTDWAALDLATVFGGAETARRAYDAAMLANGRALNSY
jgi:hypothetical protein